MIGSLKTNPSLVSASKESAKSFALSSVSGVFLVNMEIGKSHLFVNYPLLGRVGGFDEDDKILVNHITASPGSTRYCMLARSYIHFAGNTVG